MIPLPNPPSPPPPFPSSAHLWPLGPLLVPAWLRTAHPGLSVLLLRAPAGALPNCAHISPGPGMGRVWTKYGQGVNRAVGTGYRRYEYESGCISAMLCPVAPRPLRLQADSCHHSCRSIPTQVIHVIHLHCTCCCTGDRADFALHCCILTPLKTNYTSHRSSHTSTAWHWDSSRVWPKQSTRSGGRTAGRTGRGTRCEYVWEGGVVREGRRGVVVGWRGG